MVSNAVSRVFFFFSPFSSRSFPRISTGGTIPRDRSQMKSESARRGHDADSIPFAFPLHLSLLFPVIRRVNENIKLTL